MTENERHQEQVKAALDQIKSFQKRASRKWTLDIPVWRLTIEGLFVFFIAFLVGLGLAVIFELLTHWA